MFKRILAILSPTRRYHEHKPIASLLLRVFDLVLALLPARSGPLPEVPKRILLMNAAYNGDVLMSTSVIPLLRKAFPDAEIGFVGGSWANQVVANHPDLARTHVIDLFRLNRSKISLAAKLQQQWRTQVQARREIMACKYDMAIDLFTGFPPLSWFAWSCCIPCRIGYMNRGFGALLTVPLSLNVEPGKHETSYHVDLLAPLGISSDGAISHPDLPEPSEAACASAAHRLGWSSLGEYPFFVIHPGTGEPQKEWPINRWQSLLQSLASDHEYRIVLTGHGPRDRAVIDELLTDVPNPNGNVIDACGLFGWNELCAVFRHAQVVIGTDSMSGHLASAWQTPTITLATGMSDPARWRPASLTGSVLYSPRECFPCISKRGCTGMACLREVMPGDVIRSLESSRQVEGK